MAYHHTMHPKPNSTKFINCAVYTRVSVDERAVKQTYSTLDNQRDSALNYIKSQKSMGWKLFKSYEDSGQSGGTLNRPALKQMIQDIKRGHIQVIVVYKIDRLTRNHKDFYTLLEIFNQTNATFVSTTQHFDTTSSAGRLLLHIMLEFAQFEREMAQERTYDKRLAMARKGMYCGGHVPLGYDSKKKKLFINPAEAKIVRQCFELYPQLGSMGAVSKKLNEMGYRTKKFYVKGKKASGSIKFDKKKISNILANPLYIGKIRFTDNKSGKEYIFDGEHKPIVDLKTWEGVQNILATNRDTRKTFKQNKYEMLFQGLLRCGNCGSMMTNSSKRKGGKVYLYYRCVEAILKGKGACTIRTMPGDELENFLINEFKRLGQDEKLLRKSIEKANVTAKKGLAPLQKEKEAIEVQLVKINKDLRQLIDFIKSENNMSEKRRHSISEEMTDLETTKETLENETHRINTNMHHLSQHVIDVENFTKLFREFPHVFETFPFEEKRNLIMLLVKEVTYTPTKITIKFWGDLPEMKIDLKNPPDWTPPPHDDNDNGPDIPKEENPGVGASGRGRKQVRLGVSNGWETWIRTKIPWSRATCATVAPSPNVRILRLIRPFRLPRSGCFFSALLLVLSEAEGRVEAPFTISQCFQPRCGYFIIVYKTVTIWHFRYRESW